MALRLAQIALSPDRTQVVGMEDEGPARVVRGVASTYDLALDAIAGGIGLA